MHDGLWLERVIREGIASGDLAPTRGVGKPIEGLDRPHDELWWVRSWTEREQLRDALGPRSGGRPAGPEEAAGRQSAER